MRIGIDARMYGPKVGGGGLGRYVEQLITELQKIDDENRYVLFLKKENFDDCEITNPQFEKKLADVHWYTVKEQMEMPKLIDREKPDFVHFPHWNVPKFVKTPFIVTIHDLILLEQPQSARATTLGPLRYRAKYLAYKQVLGHALKNSRHIIAVSKYTKSSIGKFFPEIPTDKISVVYEGVTDLSKAGRTGQTAPLPKKIIGRYFLYVGNAYPHKNLEALLHAFSFFHKLHPEIQLVLAGRWDEFYRRLEKEADEIDIPGDRVVFIPTPSDETIKTLYNGATLYLFPSKCEGFGLPPLEAMHEGVPVAASKSSCIPEILEEAAIYFPPDDIEKMVEIMEQALTDEALRNSLIEKGRAQVKKYSWTRMAKEILKIYNSPQT